jgi:amino acid ABC transporter membrane protein, PAAT family (TC 3.A.1.3.-)
MGSKFDASVIVEVIPSLIKYIHVTIGIAAIAMVFGLVLSIVMTLVRIYKIRVLYEFTTVYISFFRGTPLLVQLFLLYYGLPQIFPVFKNMTSFTAAYIGLSLNCSAYLTEIIRGAISSVDKGQMEAALSVGMSHLQGMRRIILPQAARVALPGIGNTFVDLIKGSSLAFTLGVTEIMARAQMNAASNYRFFESYMAVALLYWGTVVLLNRGQALLEKKLNKAYR